MSRLYCTACRGRCTGGEGCARRSPNLYERRAKVISLLTEAKRCAELGLGRMILMKSFRRRPRNYDRVRVLPGVMGRIVGSDVDGRYFVDVKLDDLVAALERVMRVSGPAGAGIT